MNSVISGNRQKLMNDTAFVAQYKVQIETKNKNIFFLDLYEIAAGLLIDGIILMAACVNLVISISTVICHIRVTFWKYDFLSTGNMTFFVHLIMINNSK
jgi:hypothetical protein